MSVLLVDGSAIAYRSYHAFARAPLRSSRGEETSLTFAFTNTLLRWLQRLAPGWAAVVFDAPGRNFRHDIYADYKAGRPPMPENMSAQLPRLRQALAALRLPVLERPGCEADDVLGTLARRFEARGERVYLASGDKDFRQVVSAHVRLLRPNIPSGGDEEIGPEELERVLGLRPEQIVDLMALSGDASDNVPGVPGVGEKTAAALLRQHGSLEALYEHLDRVERPALRQRLAENRDSAIMSRRLVTLVTDLDLDIDTGTLRWPGPDWPALGALLREMELFSVLRQLPTGTRVGPEAVQYAAVDDAAELAALGRTLQDLPAFALDVETTSLDAMRAELVAISFSWQEGRAVVVPVAARRRAPPPGELDLGAPAGAGFDLETVTRLRGPAVAAAHSLKVGQNIKYDLLVLEEHGMAVAGPLFDTMVASYVLNPGRKQHGLDALALEHLDEQVQPYTALFARGDRERDIRRLPLAALVRYAGADADMTWRLRERLRPLLESERLLHLFDTVEMPLVRVLADMERIGVRVDVAELGALAGELADRAAILERQIQARCGHAFNINSPRQLGEVLFGELRLPHGRRTKSGWSTDVEVLERLAREHELPRLVLEYRQLTKLRSTYAEALPRLVNSRTGRIHTSFNQAVASTGRLSSSDPNLQNIPARTELGRRIRAAFVPEGADARLVSADYSQIELRVMAHLSQDRALQAIFHQGGDVHRLAAARIAGCEASQVTPEQRAAAKVVNFGVMYGMGPRGLADQLGIGVDEARRFIDEYFTSYPGVRRYVQETVQKARAEGFVTTLLGRRLPLPDLRSPRPELRAMAERIAVNAPIQGSAADLIKVAMVRLHACLRQAGLKARMILQVHDELVFETPVAEVEELRRLVRREMEGAVSLSVPVVVDVAVGTNWTEAH